MERGMGEGAEGVKGYRRRCPLSWVMFDSALMLPMRDKENERKHSQRGGHEGQLLSAN